MFHCVLNRLKKEIYLCFTLKRLALIFLVAMPSFQAAAETTKSSDYRWQSVKVGAGGFAPNIIFSKAEKGLVYLRTDMGGVYRFDSTLNAWVPLQDTLAEGSYMGIESIAPDPIDPNIVYMATGMYRQDASAFLRSYDRGKTWDIFPVPFKMGGNEGGRGLGERLALDPDNRARLFFGSRHDGLLISENRAKTWKKVNAFPYKGKGTPKPQQKTNPGLSFVVFASQKPANASRPIFVGVADATDTHLYRSDDSGKSWQAVKGGPSSDLLPVKATTDSLGFLYITYTNGPGPNGITEGAVWRYTIATGKWTDISPVKGDPTPGGYMGIDSDAEKPGRLVVSSINRWKKGDAIWVSEDAGNHWTNIRKTATRDVSATPFLIWGNEEADFGWWTAGLAIDPFDSSHVAYTTGATVYHTDQLDKEHPNNQIWYPWAEGIEQTAILTLRSLPEGPHLLSGFGDISGFVHEDLSVSPTVQFLAPLFSDTRVIDYAGLAPNIVVRSGKAGHRLDVGSPTLAYSTDYGFSWTPLRLPAFKSVNEKGEEVETHYDYSGDTAISVSADGKSFIAMTPTPVISRDMGKTWALMDLPLHARPVADRADAKRFYVVDFKNATILASDDGGKSFKDMKTRGLPKNIEADTPKRHQKHWPLLTTPGKAGDLWFYSVSTSRLYHSTDGGRSFKVRSKDINILQLAFGKAAPAHDSLTLFAIGTHKGIVAVWRSTDSGKTWVRINDADHEYGRRFTTVEGDLRVFGRVYVGTDGRGILYGEPANKAN